MGGWTDERVTRLRTFWAEGLSASEIARRLGGVTRNAVLGKIWRLGLSGRPTASAPRTRVVTSRRPPAPRQARSHRPRPGCSTTSSDAPMRLRAVASTGAPTVILVGLVQRLDLLGLHACRWPIGDPKAATFAFCGRRAVAGPYCPAHRRVAYFGADRTAGNGAAA